ncbi:hypothetical protein S7711_03899, partial [Stachybotrys chartarum IBT 7711]
YLCLTHCSTGATGYIGGQVLREVTRSHPEYRFTALVRDAQKAADISAAYGSVTTVIGSLDDDDIIEREASKADIVLNLASAGHLKAVHAVHRGLKSKETSEPVYWVQISGASALAAAEIASPNYVAGSPSDTVFDDLDGTAALRDLLRAHSFRAVDNYLLDVAAHASNFKTAVVFPPIIYGPGQGPGNQRSVQVPELARVILERGHGVQVGKGLSRWGVVHVRDLGRLFASLVASATADGGKAWGEEALYLTSSDEASFGDISNKVTQAAHDQGLIPENSIQELEKEESAKVLPHGYIIYGTNARSQSRRAKELLGWAPREGSLDEDIPRVVADEAKRLGKA